MNYWASSIYVIHIQEEQVRTVDNKLAGDSKFCSGRVRDGEGKRYRHLTTWKYGAVPEAEEC